MTINTKHKTVVGRGNPDAKILMLGEKPGGEELRLGKVFVGETGLELDRIMWKVGVKDDWVWIDNLLEDAPTGDDWSVTDVDLRRNADRIAQLFIDHQFDTVVAMGAVATRYLLGDGVRADIGTVHGLSHHVTSHDNIPIPNTGIDVFSTWHPAAGLHDADAYPYIMYDFQLLGAYLKGGWTPSSRIDPYHGKERYTVITDSDRDLKFLRSLFTRGFRQQLIYVDTESVHNKAWCLTFSMQGGEGFMIKAASRQAIAILAEEVEYWDMTVVLHYAVHDIPVLRSMGWAWPLLGRVMDTMIAAYLLQVEPQGLKNLAYRHAAMVMKDYLDLVGPHTGNQRLDWLLLMSIHEWGKPDPVVIEDKMETKVRQPESMDNRVAKQIKRITDDPDHLEWLYESGDKTLWKWWHELKKEYPTVVEPVIGQCGDIPTASLEDVPFDEALWYACRDADATGRVFGQLWDRMDATNLLPTFYMDCNCLPSFEEMQSTGFVANKDHFRRLIREWRGEQGRLRQQLAGMIGYYINPESAKQVEKVVYDQWKLPVFKKTEGGARSTSDKAIDWLAERHPGVKLIQRSRELDKAVSSFAEPALEMAEAQEGRVMGNLTYTRVVSGRPSMTGLNLLAFPVRSVVGKQVRDGFEAGEGNLLGSWDLNQIEMRFMAHESEDPDLLAAYWRGADIHKETASRMFGVSIEEVTDEQRDVAKRVSFGVITGITGSGLRDQFYLNGITKYDEHDCNEFIDIWFQARPAVKVYLERCRAEARRYGYVTESIGGRIRYLQGVSSRNKRIMAESERASHSHRISSGAQAILKRAQAALWPVIEDLRKTDGVWIRWILQVYDELIFEFPEGYEAVLDPIITDVMCNTTKLKVPIKAKGKWSKTWGRLK